MGCFQSAYAEYEAYYRFNLALLSLAPAGAEHICHVDVKYQEMMESEERVRAGQWAMRQQVRAVERTPQNEREGSE